MSITLFDDGDTQRWEALGTCRSLPRELVTARPGSDDVLYDSYESDPIIATQTDQMCLGCPVIRECLGAGLSRKEWGVWGGLYLENGKPNRARNSHKTDDVWDALRMRHGRNVRV